MEAESMALGLLSLGLGAGALGLLICTRGWRRFKKGVWLERRKTGAAAPLGLAGGGERELTVGSLTQDILMDFPHSAAVQKRVLINLRLVEGRLQELQQFLLIKGATLAPTARNSRPCCRNGNVRCPEQ
ncbi:kita-kyushu lung cancer antigen 1 [Ornithorhynchus anatinus]|uniref:kita-kyushu lung cancer antigen 1 n=1 Tax=Ornithorhynchus anatinus TaxID=9258 RepID=UPI0010A7767C|nr:kita-kyushu lung cancer antigen 1 [Ornithorhynchus anatinus]